MVSKSEVLAKAMEIDALVAEYLTVSVIDHISFDMLEKQMVWELKRLPISRRSFYRRRKELVDWMNEQKNN